METLIIQLISGAVGGNVAGAVLKKHNMGVLMNSVAGIIGGGIGSNILGFAGIPGLDSIIGQVAGGGVGGAILLVLVSTAKNMMGKK